MTTEQYAQKCFDGRGYMVVGSMMPLRVGALETLDDQPGTATETMAVVIAESDRYDLKAQLIAMGEPHLIPEINCRYFYRMVAE